MKKLLCTLLAAAMLTGCTAAPVQTLPPSQSATEDSTAVRFQLEKGGLSVTAPDGMAENAVTAANDIIYYEEGHDESYGEGEKWDSHSAAEAARHTVVHINAPGTYVVSGKLEFGQIAVDLGEDAKNDPSAVVTLILDGLDVTCTVAPAIIFYNVYECGDGENPTATPDTSAAGANVILAEGSQNYVNGSHVAKIYKPGTEKKLHKYDGAFYSRMSMNVGGSGELHITADNEGLDSEMHLTINGGEVYIKSGNDGINTNEDGVSVTTINGGTLSITVTGETGEGDGIDSNGWLVINGGSVFAYACDRSMDSGIDSDMGIAINGGTVVATGNMLDRIEDGGQTHAVFSFAQPQTGGTYALKNEKGIALFDITAPNGFSSLILSSPDLAEGTYTLWCGDTQFEGMVSFNGGGFFGGMHPGPQPIDRPEFPGKGDGDVEIPPQPTVPIVTHDIGQQPAPDMSVKGEGPAIPDSPDGEPPADMPMPDFGGFDPSLMPEGGQPPQMPEGMAPPRDGFGRQPIGDSLMVEMLTTDFPISPGANYFTNLQSTE